MYLGLWGKYLSAEIHLTREAEAPEIGPSDQGPVYRVLSEACGFLRTFIPPFLSFTQIQSSYLLSCMLTNILN